MRQAIAMAVLTGFWLGGCDSSALTPEGEPAARYQPVTVRHQVDMAGDRVWRLTMQGLVLHDARHPDKREVALPGWVVADSAHACLPDLAIGPRGEAVVTSNVLPILWRVDPETLAVSEHRLALDADNDKDVGFSALVYSAQHGAYFAVSEAHRSLWKIDAALTRAERIAVSGRFPGGGCRLALGARVAPGPRAKVS